MPIEAAIVPEDELVEVCVEMLSSQPMIGAQAPALHQREDAMDPGQGDMTGHLACQSACKIDPRSASNFDPLERRVRTAAVAPSELVGVAETARARVGV